jgi:hypothetical protein
MDTEPSEYHPYAACLMHLACRSPKTVRENMDDLKKYFSEEGKPTPLTEDMQRE